VNGTWGDRRTLPGAENIYAAPGRNDRTPERRQS
jgi:hypothetical protein